MAYAERELSQTIAAVKREATALFAGQSDDVQLRRLLASTDFLLKDGLLYSRLLGYIEPFAPRSVEMGIRDWPKVFLSGVKDKLDRWRFPELKKAVDWLLGNAIVSKADMDRFDQEAEAAVLNQNTINSQKRVDEIRQVIAQSVNDGLSIRDFQSKLDEVVSLEHWHAETIYRTNYKNAHVTGLDELLKSRAGRPFKFVQYVSTMDTRTRPSHLVMDGKTAAVGSEEYEAMLRLQKEINCRCTLIPLRKEMP